MSENVVDLHFERFRQGSLAAVAKECALELVGRLPVLLKEHLGSVRVTVNDDGDVIGYADYYPFGQQIAQRTNGGGSVTKENFTGHELDDETGLLYAGARYYDPSLGRWMSPDPHADSYPGWSPYNYVLNNPLVLTDPTGLCPDEDPECPREVDQAETLIDAAVTAIGAYVQTYAALVLPSKVEGTVSGAGVLVTQTVELNSDLGNLAETSEGKVEVVAGNGAVDVKAGVKQDVRSGEVAGSGEVKISAGRVSVAASEGGIGIEVQQPVSTNVSVPLSVNTRGEVKTGIAATVFGVGGAQISATYGPTNLERAQRIYVQGNKRISNSIYRLIPRQR